MMPFYAPFSPFNPYYHRRVNNNYEPYNNLHNSSLNSNNFKESPCFPSISSKKEYGNFGSSLNNTNNSNFYKNDCKNVNKNNNFYFKKDNNYCCNNDFNDNNNNSNINKNENMYVGDFYNNSFEIFGLKLDFDDLLIIAMLFFLYKEEVNDTYLYIALILLLLT